MRRLFAGAGVLAAAVLIGAPIVAAATPEEIYRDYADNGRLDATYSPSDLQRALKDAVVQGYGGPKGKTLVPTVKKTIGEVKGETEAKTNPPSEVPPVKSEGGGLPFTGLDLALITLGGASLLVFGAGLRRFARRTD